MLPGWLLGGAGVGLAMPTILSAATMDLPASRRATGSAVVNMNRQIGAVLGVSMLVVFLGTPHGFAELRHGFQSAWIAVAVVALLCAVLATRMGASVTAPRVAVPER